MDGLVDTHEVPASEEPENTSAAMVGSALEEESTASDDITWRSFEHETNASCQWDRPYDEQVDNLKESWKRVLEWTGARIDFENNFQTNPWFASAVLQLRNAPCLDSCEVEIDQSLLGLLVSGSKLTSLNLAIMMRDIKLVEEILNKNPAPNDEIHRPLVDPQRATAFLNIVIDDPMKTTGFLFTPLHLSTFSTRDILRRLIEKAADMYEPNWLLETPLELVLQKKGHGGMDYLLALRLRYNAIAVRYGTVNHKKKLTLHNFATKWHKKDDVTSLVKYVRQRGDIDINDVDESGLSALHVAILCCNTEFVNALLECFSGSINLNEEYDKDHGPPIQIAFEGGDEFKDIERALTECNSVKGYMDNLYRDRQVYVDAANAILVGAALIASVTFASWLQPPLNYTSYSGEGYSSSIPTPATSDLNYVDVEHNIPLRAFWVFNALSFYFAIGSVVCGARSVLPRRHLFIKKIVEKLRTDLLVTSVFLACSMLFVIIAFAIAGTIVLTPSLKYQWYMIIPTLVGGLVCIISLVFMVKSMREIFSDKRGKSKRFNSTNGDAYYRDYLKNRGYKL